MVRADEAWAYVSSPADGTVLEVDLDTGLRRVLATGLPRPGCLAWFDESLGLVLAACESGVAVVDLSTGDFRVAGGLGQQPSGLVRVGDVVLAASDALIAVDARLIQPARIVLSSPARPLCRGGYSRVDVSLGSSGLGLDDLSFDVAEGPEFGGVSRSRDSLADPAHPQVVLLAGPHPGVYTLRATDSTGVEQASTTFEVVERWSGPDGPPMAFTGVNRVFTSGGAWGSQFNGAIPFDFEFSGAAVTGIRRVALIFCNTSDVSLPAGTQQTFRDALTAGVVGSDNVVRSAAAYYAEVSDGRLAIVLGGESTVTLPRTWADYKEPLVGRPNRFKARHDLAADAMWRAQPDIDFRFIDTAVFVVPSPNGGVPLPPFTLPLVPPITITPPPLFCWPVAQSGTYILNSPAPPLMLAWWWKSLPWISMPAEWESLDARRVFHTLSHELGHTIGLPDLYGDDRAVSGYEVMVDETNLPSMSLPVQVLLGWVDPASLRIYNFRVENPVDETITLTATERLGAGGPPPKEWAGAAIEVTEGQRYYFEYRSRQDFPPGSAGSTQVADQGMPEDRRVVGTDVVAGWYSPPVQRKPVRFLADDGDGEGPVLAVGEDYEELDVAGGATFRLSVVSADDSRAVVRVRYQPTPSPEPPWPNGPDPSIRPWPGGDNWQSPDLTVTNALGNVNIPWAGHSNTIQAVVTNGGTVPALGVRVGFWVKDFTVSATGPETFLGWATADVPAKGTTTFTMGWVPPAQSGFFFSPVGFAHYCVVARIAPHSQGTPPRGEISYANNEAQTNYTILFTMAGSPYDRVTLPVVVSNPYADRSVRVELNAQQTLEHFRTYLGATSLRLGPGESRTVELMVECIADEPPFNDTVTPAELYANPNIVSAVAVIEDGTDDVSTPIGGATIEVRAARRTRLASLDISAANSIGRVELADGTPVKTGEVVIAIRPDGAVPEVVYRTTLTKAGAFSVATSHIQTAVAKAGHDLTLDVLYLGDGELGPCSTSVQVR